MLTTSVESHPAEKANHARISEILESLTPHGLITAPKVILGIDEYITEVTDRRSPLWYQYIWDSIIPEAQEVYISILRKAITELAKQDFYLRGVQVYLQTDGTLKMTSFSKIHHSKEKTTLLDLSNVLPPSILANYW
jgi:hypothetical protein